MSATPLAESFGIHGALENPSVEIDGLIGVTASIDSERYSFTAFTSGLSTDFITTDVLGVALSNCSLSGGAAGFSCGPFNFKPHFDVNFDPSNPRTERGSRTVDLMILGFVGLGTIATLRGRRRGDLLL